MTYLCNASTNADLIKTTGLIKKHLNTCSVILLLIVFSALNFYGTNKKETIKESVKFSPIISKFILKVPEVKTPDAEDDYTFAEEAVPVENAGVNRKMQRSLEKHNYRHVHSNILQRKAEKIFPIIEPILRAYGVPEDFKFIPLVEGGFSEGTSSKGAKGLWQFMPGTARAYGLKVGHGMDERTNIRKSTIAACRYIKGLYEEFDSWTLAAAAYNNGSIKLSHAMNQQNEDNYFRMHLNRETGVYVYNLVAMKAIITQPVKYGFKKQFINTTPLIKNLQPSELIAAQ
jgi:membrane-bound lytic murein transglycosylase D